MRFLWICVAGAAGTGARFLLSGFATSVLGSEFPYGTLVVNVLGSLLLGVIMHVGLATELLSPTLRLALTTGFLGGFTTYSTFNYETLLYLQEGVWARALANVVLTLGLCGFAGVGGIVFARWLVGN